MCRKLVIALLFLLALPAHGQAQDLRILEALFRQINSFTIAMHGGDLIGTSEFDARCGAFGLCGMGTEVFINLHDTETLLLELALGTSYLQGFTAREETLDFRGAIRSVPTIAIYMTSRNPGGQEWVHPFIGASFGLTELWNAQAYDPDGTRYALRGSTYDQGVLAGVSINVGPITGLFLETSYRRRRFFSVEWTFPAGVQRVPEGWPRELNLNSWLVSVGWQFDIPNPAGRWVEGRGKRERQERMMRGLVVLKRAFSMVVVLLLAACATGAPAAQDALDARAARVERVENGLRPGDGGGGAGVSILERMRHYEVPGVSVAVIDGGRIAWARGYGVVKAGSTQPVDTATLFQAASISKPVAAIAALRLVERGVLSLDEDVNGRLVAWKVPENGLAGEQKVTLRRLLSHSAGLTVHGFRGYAAGEPVPSLVQLLSGAPPANSAAVQVDLVPGSRWRYSGGGTSVAQLLMSEATGRPFPALMQELVLGPARMIHSTYEQPLPAARAARAATGHRRTGEAVRGKWHTYPEMAAAGLWTTPSDLARLGLEVQRALRGEPGALLTPETAREMLTRQSGAYGLGFGVEGEGETAVFSHGGSNEGFRAIFLVLRERGQGAVVMTNGDNGGALAGEILRSLAREYGWPILQSASVAPRS